MHSKDAVNNLKSLLRQEVTKFCNRNHRIWKQPILKTINELKEMNWPAVFFGGTLRSLIISRCFNNQLGRPRDIDIVIKGITLEAIKDHFHDFIARETRFGGFKLERGGWQFDVWPLEKTWAFTKDSIGGPEFVKLPETTFFNLEAIAIEVWPKPGKPRKIYSGDDRFFHGIINKTLEINLEDNPYPQLNIVRALMFAGDLDFYIGPKLIRYILENSNCITDEDLEDIQIKHYGYIRLSGSVMQSLIQFIRNSATANNANVIKLPQSKQAEIWPKNTYKSPHINIRCISNASDGI